MSSHTLTGNVLCSISALAFTRIHLGYFIFKSFRWGEELGIIHFNLRKKLSLLSLKDFYPEYFFKYY